jgi:predicted MFS family arabinose efflux permease
MRRLLILASAIVFVDTMFFAAVVPILPALSDEFGLSKSVAGVLAGAYAAGTLIAAIPGGLLAARIGVRPTLTLGLGLMTVSGLAFAIADDATILIVARFVQGMGGAASWAGALGWVLKAAPADRRGEMIGTALGAAIGGVLFGPALGAAAEALGRGPVFGAVAVAGLALIAWTRRLEPPAVSERPSPGSLARLASLGPVRLGMWLILVPGMVFGTLDVLVPLRLDDLGAGAGAIAAIFLVAAGVEALVSPFAGRVSDRRGRMAPLRFGMAGSMVVLCVIGAPSAIWLLGLTLVVGSAVVGVLWSPAMAMLSDSAETAAIDQALAFGVVNLGWGLGHTIGALGGAGLGEAVSDTAAYLVLAAVCALTLVALNGRRDVVVEPA